MWRLDKDESSLVVRRGVIGLVIVVSLRTSRLAAPTRRRYGGGMGWGEGRVTAETVFYRDIVCTHYSVVDVLFFVSCSRMVQLSFSR